MNRKVTLLKLLKYIGPHKLLLSGLIIFTLIYVVSLLFIPIIIGQGIDLIGNNNVNLEGIISKIAVLLVLIIINSLARFVSEACSSMLNYRIGYDIRIELLDKINSSHIKDLDKLERGDLLSKLVNDVEQIGMGLTQHFQVLLSGIITVIGTIIFMLTLNFTISIIVIVLTPVSLFLALALGKKSYIYHYAQSELKGKITNKIEEIVNYHTEIKGYNREKSSELALAEINNRLYNVGLKAQFMQAIGNPGTRFINNVIYSLIAVVGGLLVIDDFITVGTLIVFLTYASQYAKPFNEFTTIISDMQSALSSAERVFKVLEDKNTSKVSEGGEKLQNCQGEFDINNISFSYKKEEKLLQNISLKTKKGDVIAIVGKTGSGKTTLVNLLLRFYDIDEGAIYLDNKNLYSLSLESLRENIGMVLQDTWVFTGTLRDNIAYAKTDAPFEEIKRAAKLAHCHSFAKKLKEGYNTIIGEGGERLSKGEEQLVAIARIMLKDPEILILDEATSDIDTRTEMKIQSGFRKLMKNKTTFIVAHRLSTIKNADLILVMDAGNIVEQGTHKELLNKKGHYYNLYKAD